ncbi:DNA polymerase III subunit gamma/tau [Humisphaera borealis]|uniref:DNA polymerase III subunit gamma/tau n=1 Tax=Humisphaera borealis TaxID=2807512 RepID=A0A7M2WRG2_9BACT|nr:DNA polymerase III subunit gamma/tau [Humisphaera borealis]QOV88013.1 DNA polymerase III subunit gamma/tau [Humisphaera borealis]
MSYTVLARRYRSTTFDEVIGQEHVGQTLKKAIECDRVAHAYLFTGTRGVGKTSMARIMAKALNCHSFDKPTPTPCGTCDSCLRVAKGDDMDVIEIDAASNTGVDNVRDIIENAQYRPGRSRFKVYIIDEVHMLSKAAFNALLKTMEEPPPHVKFILATTEVEKVLPTILSRCQRYDFRNIPTREIAAHLKDICQQEKIASGDDALLLVAKAGAGSMRDALSLLDRLLSVGEKKLDTDLIESMLGLPKSQLLFDLAQAIGDGDIKAALTRATSMINAGQSVDSLIAALTDHLRNLLILRTCGADSELVEVPGLSLNDMVSQSERFDPAALVQDITILEELRRHVRQSQAGRALLDATIVRMAMSDQFAAIGNLLSQLEGPGNGGAATTRPAARTGPAAAPGSSAAAQKKKTDELTPTAPAAPRADPAPSVPSTPAAPSISPTATPSVSQAVHAMKAEMAATASAVPPASPPAPLPVQTASTPSVPVPTGSVLDSIDFGDDDLPRPGKVWEDDTGPSLAEMVKAGSSASSAASANGHGSSATGEVSVDAAVASRPAGTEDLHTAWAVTIDSLKPQVGIHSVMSQSRLDRLDPDGFAVISIPARCESFARQWDRNGKKDIVRDALGKAMGRGVGVRFEVEAEPEPVVDKRQPDAQRPPSQGSTSQSPTAQTKGPPSRGGDSRSGHQRPIERPAPPPPAPAQRITQEQAEAIRAQVPLIEALVTTLNAQIVKIE